MSDLVQDALARLQNELKRLEPAVEHIENARTVTAKVGELPVLFEQQRVAIERAYSDKLAKFEEQLTSVNQKHEKYLQDTTSAFKTETEKLSKSAKGTVQAIQTELESLQKLQAELRSYHDAIVAINFPTRLDKIDSTVSGIMAATQTTQGRVDNLERATSEKLTALTSAVEKQQVELMASIAKANKSTRTLLFISIVFSVVVLAAIAYLLTRS